MELMANFSLNIKKIENEFNINFFEKFKTEIEDLKEFESDNLLEIDKNYIKVNKTGTLLIRNVALPFDEYYRRMSNKKAFSKSV
jgi:oxygen-independent coproporphyrinogen-3 oxidase